MDNCFINVGEGGRPHYVNANQIFAAEATDKFLKVTSTGGMVIQLSGPAANAVLTWLAARAEERRLAEKKRNE